MSVETADSLIEKWIKLKDHVAAQSKQFDEFLKPFKQEMNEIENKLLAKINSEGGESIKTGHGTAYLSTITTPKVTDRGTYLDFCLDIYDREGDCAMLQLSAPNKDSVTEFMEANEGQLPPGVTTSSFTRVNIRRT